MTEQNTKKRTFSDMSEIEIKIGYVNRPQKTITAEEITRHEEISEEINKLQKLPRIDTYTHAARIISLKAFILGKGLRHDTEGFGRIKTKYVKILEKKQKHAEELDKLCKKSNDIEQIVSAYTELYELQNELREDLSIRRQDQTFIETMALSNRLSNGDNSVISSIAGRSRTKNFL